MAPKTYTALLGALLALLVLLAVAHTREAQANALDVGLDDEEVETHRNLRAAKKNKKAPATKPPTTKPPTTLPPTAIMPCGSSETGWAKALDKSIDWRQKPYNIAKWGWTNGPYTNGAQVVKFEIYAGAGQNEISKGYLVGYGNVTIKANKQPIIQFEATYPDVVFAGAVKAYIGTTAVTSVAPGQMPITVTSSPNLVTNPATIPNNWYFYIHFDAVRSGPGCQPKSPSVSPSQSPSQAPSLSPTEIFGGRRPTTSPTASSPTSSPSESPTVSSPTTSPSTAPTTTPTTSPSTAPTTSPSTAPTTSPSTAPTTSPSTSPTTSPSTAPTTTPTTSPSTAPTTSPSTAPTTSPSTAPTTSPSTSPTTSPSTAPTTSPSTAPTTSPSTVPTTSPSKAPTTSPSTAPTTSPSKAPSTSPTQSPSASPTISPSASPSASPTNLPTTSPTTTSPSSSPTKSPSKNPTFSSPTASPTEPPISCGSSGTAWTRAPDKGVCWIGGIYGQSNWGWTSGPYDKVIGAVIPFEIWFSAGGCSLSSGTLVGFGSVEITGTGTYINYQLTMPNLIATSVKGYIGEAPLLIKNNKPVTSGGGQLPITVTSTHTLVTPSNVVTNPFYFYIHFEISATGGACAG